jgi:DNA-directed RNA polymerase sigma subunit (sigma70/sigma32)
MKAMADFEKLKYEELKEYIENIVLASLATTKEHQKELMLKADQGDLDAKQELAATNLFLVLEAVEDILPLLIQEMIEKGNIQLFRALESYTSEKGPFSTYAETFIKSELEAMTKRFIEQNQ